jgi:hypothetical protein
MLLVSEKINTMSTIIVNLKGGLGNQMFQYAAGRALALRNGSELKVNVFGLEKANLVGDIYRPYSLSHFDVKAAIATEEDMRRIANPYGLVSKVLRYIKAKFIYNFYIHFVPSIVKKKGDIYLDGFFQSEKYFMDHAASVREDLRPTELSDEARRWIEHAKNTVSVSIHIRRKDYIGHKTLGDICTKEYYSRAVKEMRTHEPKATFFVFSDDVEWVKENLDLPASREFVSSKDLKDYEELAIMSSCRHNIIANSSFSWWAAWLNPNPEKIVMAPALWARGKEGKKQTRDIIPGAWTRIDTAPKSAL